MNYGCDENIFLQSIDDPIAINDQLSDILVIEFRNFGARFWELRQHSGLVDDFLHNSAGVGGRVSGE